MVPLSQSPPTHGGRRSGPLPVARLGAVAPMTPPRWMAEQRGAQAHREGLALADNPFPPKTTAWAWWRRGWHAQAHADHLSRSVQPAAQSAMPGDFTEGELREVLRPLWEGGRHD
jgi:hypothetical protein